MTRVGVAVVRGLRSAIRRCAIYTRKSTAVGPDVSLSSLDAQREVCEDYVNTKRSEGWQALAERYDDGGYTGANLERPAFKRLMADIAAGKIDVVVVYKVDRLSRSLLDFAEVVRFFEKYGVAFVSVTQSFSTADAMGRLVLNMLMSFSEFEREMIAERTRDKIAVARRRGKWTGGVVPFGYQLVESKLVPVAALAPTVRRAFDTYLQRRSILEVARLLDELSPRTTRAGVTRRWARNDVQRLVTNPIYAGLMRVPGGGFAEGEHMALIDRDTYERAAGGGGAPRSEPGNTDAYFLRGLLRCGACGAALTPSTTPKKRKFTTHQYRYYRCMSRNRHGARTCPVAPVSADVIEAAVVGAIKGAVATPALRDAVADATSQHLAEQLAQLVHERSGLPTTMGAHTRRAEELAARLATLSHGERKAVEDEMTEALAAVAAVERRLIEVDAQVLTLREAAQDFTWVREVLAHFDPVWSALAPSERNRMLALLIERVVVTSEHQVHVEWRPWEVQ